MITHLITGPVTWLITLIPAPRWWLNHWKLAFTDHPQSGCSPPTPDGRGTAKPLIQSASEGHLNLGWGHYPSPHPAGTNTPAQRDDIAQRKPPDPGIPFKLVLMAPGRYM